MNTVKDIFKDKLLLILTFLSFGLLVASLVLILINKSDFSDSLIIHINAFKGVDMMGDVADLWNVLIMGGLIFIINTLVGYTFYLKEKILTYVILSLTFISSLLVLIKIANIISIN
jgi:hypothetical protein